jgi:hypothetical protein
VLCTFTCWFYIRFAPLHSVVAWVAADLLLSSALLFVVAYVFERVVDRSGIQFSQWFVRGFSSQPASSALK